MKKNELVLMMALITIILFLSMLLSGCTSNQRYDIENLYFSADGTKLVSMNNGQRYHDTKLLKSGSDIQVWDTYSGNEVWKKFYDAFFSQIYLSNDGHYLTVDSSIYNISSNKLIKNISGIFQDWSIDGKLFLTRNGSKTLNVFNIDDYSLNKTIEINETILSSYEMKISPDNLKILFVPEGKKSIGIIDINSNKTIILQNCSIQINETLYGDNNKIYWSNNGKKVGLIYSREHYISGRFIKEHYIIIWDSIGGLKLNEIFLNDTGIKTPIISSDFEKYGYLFVPYIYPEKYKDGGYWGKDKTVFKIFNLSDNSQILEIGTGEFIYSYYPSYDWSYNTGKIAIGTEGGSIYLFNSSNGKIIKKIDTPIHTINIPGFELVLVLIAIVLVLFWKRKRI